MRTRSFLLISMLVSFCVFARAQYVTVNNTCGFVVSNTAYKPLVCNYGISFLKDGSNISYISPRQGYSQNWDGSVTGNWCFYSNANSNASYAATKITSDMQKLKNLGFTEIRLYGAGLVYNGSSYTYSTGESLSSGGPVFFNLLNSFLSTVSTATNGSMRVILLLGGQAEFYGNDSYTTYMEAVANSLKTNTTLMAYDLMNEPANNIWPSDINNAKFYVTKMVNEWNAAVKSKDPNHLTTIGIYGPGQYIASFDPMLMNVDFISFHLYPSIANLTQAENEMDVMTYWLGKTITLPWIIGETSYAGNDVYHSANPTDTRIGTEADQKSFAAYTLPKSVHCNCKGYSWWEYQEINVNTSAIDKPDNYMGLYHRGYSNSSAPYTAAYIEGAYKPIGDPSTSPFLSYQGTVQNKPSCPMPSAYYTIYNGTSLLYQGYIYDSNSAAVANAVVTAKDVNGIAVTTFTDGSGHYSISKTSTMGTISSLQATSPGYSVSVQSYPTTGNSYNFTITKIDLNAWQKQSSNASWSNKLHVVDGSGTDWTMSASDKFYRGDFNGDGKQDLLCVQSTAGNTDRMAMFTWTQKFTSFTIGSGDTKYDIASGWSIIWDNGSSSSNGGGIYPYRNNLNIGDFNGDGKDDALSIGSWTTWFTFTPNSNPALATWQWIDSNYGTVNDPTHPMSYMAPYSSGAIAGDFYGTGKAAVITKSSTWLTSFSLNSSGQWSWVQSNQGQTNNSSAGYGMSFLTPYMAQLQPGDFDGDGQMEVLGNALPSGALAVYKAYWNSTNMEWSWSQKWYDANGSTSGMGSYRNQLIVGNFDPDASDEILGLNSTYAVVFDYGNTSSSTWNCGWDGSYYSKISDWNISANTTNGKYLFINTNSNSTAAAKIKQQQLLAMNSSTQTANLYSFRSQQPFNSCSTLRLAPEADSIPPAPPTELTAYPNPNSGNFTLRLPVDAEGTPATVFVYDMLGNVIFSREGITESNLAIDLGEHAKGIYIVRCAIGESISNKKVIIQ